MPLALILGVLHAFTDAATVTVLFRATGGEWFARSAVFAWVLGYDLVAFGLQPLLGWVQDRWATPRAAMVVGLGLTLLGVTVLQVGSSTPAALPTAVILAAVGNAVFHLGSGAQVLRQGLDRAARVGVLVAPGALGLGCGVWFGKHPTSGPAWLIAVPVLVALVIVAMLRLPSWERGDAVATDQVAMEEPPRRQSARRPIGEPMPAADVPVIVPGILVLLMMSIAIRSLVGMSASRGYAAGPWLLVGIPVVAFSGKMLGGFLADRFGWVRTTVTALVASAPVLAFTYSHPAALLIGLLMFQMTMPVTLVAIARLMPDRLATGFGMTCLALIIGGVPTMFAWGADMCSRPMLGWWVLLSACVAWAGLHLLGMTWTRGVGPDPLSTVHGHDTFGIARGPGGVRFPEPAGGERT